MGNLSDGAIRASLVARLSGLTPDAKPLWGVMTAPQMVAHLNDAFRLAAGQILAKPASSMLQRTLVKWIALRAPMQWPHGVKTRPEVEQGKGGTPPGRWENDCADLVTLIESFAAIPDFSPHPIFGKMSRADWLRWGYRHVDHHLRQFGV